MSILQAYPQGVLLFGLALLVLVHCAVSVRGLGRTFTTWRDGGWLSRLAARLGIMVLSLTVLELSGAGLLTVLAYHRDQPAIRDVVAKLRSEPVTWICGAALLKQVGGFESLTRPTLAPAPPAVTEALRAGTSLDKALWLLARLDNSAARLAVGDDRAWVESSDAYGEELIFDPSKREPSYKRSNSGARYVARRVWSGADFAGAVQNPK